MPGSNPGQATDEFYGVRGVTVCMRPCEGRGDEFDSRRTPFFNISKTIRWRGSTQKGADLVNRIMLVRNQPSALQFKIRRWSQMVRRLPAKQFSMGSIPIGVFWNHSNLVDVVCRDIPFCIKRQTTFKTEPTRNGE